MANEYTLPTILIVGSIIAAPFVGTSGGHRYDDGDAYEPAEYTASAPAFDNCKDDCSGHQAGFEWAESKGITDPSDCSGNSQSFIEGCQVYAESAAGDDS
ncbi:MAG: hypothetical protein AB7E72_16090 [Lysobacterales bacterium]